MLRYGDDLTRQQKQRQDLCADFDSKEPASESVR